MKSAERGGAVRQRQPRDRHVVLDRDRNAMQRPEHIAAHHRCLGGARVRPRGGGHRQREDVQRRLYLRGARQHRLGDIDRRHLPRRDHPRERRRWREAQIVGRRARRVPISSWRVQCPCPSRPDRSPSRASRRAAMSFAAERHGRPILRTRSPPRKTASTGTATDR